MEGKRCGSKFGAGRAEERRVALASTNDGGFEGVVDVVGRRVARSQRFRRGFPDFAEALPGKTPEK